MKTEIETFPMGAVDIGFFHRLARAAAEHQRPLIIATNIPMKTGVLYLCGDSVYIPRSSTRGEFMSLYRAMGGLTRGPGTDQYFYELHGD